MKAWRTYLPWASVFVLVVLYVVGFVGMHTASAAWFVSLSPLTLLISTAFILLNEQHWTGRFALLLLLVLLIGFWVEVLGVRTGIIFGEYAYGETLGWKWLDVPLIIACNWLLMVLSAGTLLRHVRLHPVLRVVAGAALMTGLDVLIEPVAIALGYWSWDGGTPPFQNFLGWFVVSLLMQALQQRLRTSAPNPVALALLALQVLFFIGLNVFPASI